jgi:hypothetical protein
MLPLNGPSFRGVVKTVGRGPLWIVEATQAIVGGMSGSPILAKNGSAIGVVTTPQGPNPRLASHLPGWLLGELGLRSSKFATAKAQGLSAPQADQLV